MPRFPVVGGDSDAWGTILNEFLSVVHKADGTLEDNVVDSNAIDGADAVNIRALLSLYSQAETYSQAQVNALIDDLSGVTNATAARANIDVNSTGEITALLAGYLLLTGGVMSGALTLSGNPTLALHATPKQYVDLGSIKGWALYNQDTPAVLDSYNVTSIIDNSVGNFTVNWTTSFASANYAVAGSAGEEVDRMFTALSKATGSFGGRVYDVTSGSLIDDSSVSIIATGNQ